MPLSSTDEFVQRHVRAGTMFVAPGEVAVLLGVSAQCIRNEVEKGAIPALRIGRTIRIHLHDLVRYCAPKST
jgi:excisionase family DNA binding protein